MENLEYQAETNIQEPQEEQPQLDEKDLKLQELENRTREYEEKIQRMERGYQEVQQQRDKLVNQHADKIEAILKQQQKPQAPAEFSSASDFDKYWDTQTDSILNAYNNGDITEIEKDRKLVMLNRDVMDKKAKFIAEQQINEYKNEYQYQQKVSSAQKEYESVWHNNNLTDHIQKNTPFYTALLQTINDNFDIDKINANDESGKFKGDPKMLKAAIEMTKLKHPELSEGSAQKKQQPQFTGIHTAQGQTAQPVESASNKIDIDPGVLSMIRSSYDEKTANMILSKIKAGKMSYGG